MGEKAYILSCHLKYFLFRWDKETHFVPMNLLRLYFCGTESSGLSLLNEKKLQKKGTLKSPFRKISYLTY